MQSICQQIPRFAFTKSAEKHLNICSNYVSEIIQHKIVSAPIWQHSDMQPLQLFQVKCYCAISITGANGVPAEDTVPTTPTTPNVVIQIEPITDLSEDHKIIELEDLETNEKINLLICTKQHSSLEVGDKKPLEKKQRSLDLHSNSEFAVVHPTNLSHSDSSILRRGSHGSALKLIASGSYEKVITQLYIPMEERC